MNEQPIEMNATIRISGNALSVDMDGETVAMNMDNDEFYGIDAIGSLVWRLIETQEMTVESLYKQLTEQFSEDDPQQIRSDLFAFLNACRDYGVIAID
jgi:hypothetical protein